MTFTDISKFEGRIKVLREALWNREQKLLAMGSTAMYLEYAMEHRLHGERIAAAACLEKASTRYREAVRHYHIQARLEGKNVHT